MEVFFLLIIVGVAYLLPALVASSKNHPNSGAIWLFTLFLGWTGCLDYSVDMGFKF